MECPAVTVADERSTHGNPEVAFRDFGQPLHQTITGKTGVAGRPRATVVAWSCRTRRGGNRLTGYQGGP
jgi:hypothetical protein